MQFLRWTINFAAFIISSISTIFCIIHILNILDTLRFILFWKQLCEYDLREQWSFNHSSKPALGTNSTASNSRSLFSREYRQWCAFGMSISHSNDNDWEFFFLRIAIIDYIFLFPHFYFQVSSENSPDLGNGDKSKLKMSFF